MAYLALIRSEMNPEIYVSSHKPHTANNCQPARKKIEVKVDMNKIAVLLIIELSVLSQLLVSQIPKKA
jgi:hypothetical protein